jgi:hypothetical protein
MKRALKVVKHLKFLKKTSSKMNSTRTDILKDAKAKSKLIREQLDLIHLTQEMTELLVSLKSLAVEERLQML